MKEKYEKLLKIRQESHEKEVKNSRLMGYFRLLIVIALPVLLWQGYRNGCDLLKLALIGVVVLVSVILWFKHDVICRKVDYLSVQMRIAEQYIARIGDEWTSFPDDGSEYMDYNHPYTYDLDIFGPKSIFQLLNVSATYHGRQQFAKDLESPAYSPVEIEKRQEAVSELAEKEQFSHDFQYRGSKIKDRDNIPSLLEKIKEENVFIKNEWASLIFRYMPWLFTPVALVILIFGIRQLYITAFVLLGILLVSWMYYSYKTHKYLSVVDKVKYGLDSYGELFELVGEQEFESEILKRIQEDAARGGHSAAAAVKQLDKIVAKIGARSNGILYVILNILLLWDVNCAIELSKWKERYGPYCDLWFESLGEMESLLSFSVLGNVTTGINFPRHVNDEKQLKAEGIGHPLIHYEKRVCNDFHINDNITIISGSNMSGKTTFLRTIGLNLVLAQAGAGVCARSMEFSDFTIATSMRITDDLNEGISTFYAELKKIKTIINMAEANPDIIFLIDEIFRGTNSSDRITGAKAVISTLFNEKACGFLTTHDLSLCHYSDGTKVSNWHFSEQYHDDQLTFDYKIKTGIAETTNGKYLMRMIGILKDENEDKKN